MAGVTVPDISRINWHLVGAIGATLSQALMILAAVTVAPGLELRGWLRFGASFAIVGLLYFLLRHHQTPGWWMVWPVVCIFRTFVFGASLPGAAQLTTGLITLFFLFAGLTQPPGRSLFLLPLALIVLRSLIDQPLHLAIVRLIIAAIVLSLAAELPAYLLRHLAAQQKILTRNAGTDSLTGAQNRRGLDDLLDRMQGRAFLVIVDLDDFKRYNDTFGHLAGDQVLVEFSAMLHEETRRNDVVVRYGGEEFLIVLADANQRRAELVVERWAKAWRRNGSGITFSAGVTDLEGADALRRADTSLYAAKAAGRARSVVSLSGMGVGTGVGAIPRARDAGTTGEVLESQS